MNKLLKNTTLSVVLLTTTFQTIPTPCDWHICMAWLWGNPQPQENPDQAPAGVTTDDYIAQFKSDMNGQSCVIPWDEMQEMEAAIRQELRNIDLRNKDKVNNIILGVACNQVSTGTKRDMLTLAYEEGCYYTQKEYETIPVSYENNMIARLGRMPHLNGPAIAQYYGETRKNSLRNISRNRTTYR